MHELLKAQKVILPLVFCSAFVLVLSEFRVFRLLILKSHLAGVSTCRLHCSHPLSLSLGISLTLLPLCASECSLAGFRSHCIIIIIIIRLMLGLRLCPNRRCVPIHGSFAQALSLLIKWPRYLKLFGRVYHGMLQPDLNEQLDCWIAGQLGHLQETGRDKGHFYTTMINLNTFRLINFTLLLPNTYYTTPSYETS